MTHAPMMSNFVITVIVQMAHMVFCDYGRWMQEPILQYGEHYKFVVVR